MNDRNWSDTLAIVVLGVLAFAGVCSGERRSSDYLSPLERVDEKITRYHVFLTEKLGVTPFDCGRVVDEPSFGPESIISIYSQTHNGRRAFYESSVQAEANLWQRSKSMGDMGQTRAVGIRRVDAEIPQGVAEHIRQVWLRMLRDRHPWERSRLEFALSGYLRFSIQQPDGSPLEAELWLPAREPKRQALVQISEALWNYCRAAPASRPAIAKKIDREANRLLAWLK